jgi:hypothetical protein
MPMSRFESGVLLTSLAKYNYLTSLNVRILSLANTPCKVYYCDRLTSPSIQIFNVADIVC